MERHQDRLINMTAALEALAPFVNDPRRTVIRAEASTSVVMVLLLLQLILGSFRRQTSSVWVQAGTWVTYTLSFPAIAYTLGMMQSSPVKNVLYPIWGLALLQAAGCTNAVNVYGLSEHKEWKRNLFNYFQYFLYSAMICWLLSPGRLDIKGNWKQTYKNGFTLVPKSSDFENLKTPVLLITFLACSICYGAILGRDGACRYVEYGYTHVRRVSKFMTNLPAANDHDGYDPVSMKGYRYPVHFTGALKIFMFITIPKFMRPPNPNKKLPANDDKAIAIDQIWQCEGRLLRSHKGGLKDVCLAYAMYQLLKRRYYGMACAEEHLDETRDFVLKGLLRGTDDDYERAFRIVEMELGFCHDYLFTKHAIIFELETAFFILFLVRTILVLMVAYVVWINTLSVKTLTAIIEVESTRADNIITVLVLGIIVLIELMQAAFYMASDWCKVSIACRYFARSWYQGNAFFEMIMGCLSRFMIFGHWKNRIDQYSVLSKLSAADMADKSDLQAVKLAIVGTLRSCDGLPTNGEGSLRRNGVFTEFSWALEGQPQVEIMLVWHIATEHVNAALSGKEEETKFHRQVSVCLSRYCAYLMNSAPELLPGYFGDTRFVMRDVNEVARSQDDGLQDQEVGSPKQDQEEDGGIHMKGVKLGKQLLKDMTSIADRWKFLADFWTEKILYIAPSDDVKAHMERLANGGEFLTHIWVLLTHAGIHKINREDGKNTMPSQPTEASV